MTPEELKQLIGEPVSFLPECVFQSYNDERPNVTYCGKARHILFGDPCSKRCMEPVPNPTCQMTMSYLDGGAVEQFHLCGKPAKCISPGDERNSPMLVCGIHRNSINAMYKRIDSPNRCIPLKEKT